MTQTTDSAAKLLAQVAEDERLAEKGQDLIRKLCLPRDHHERRAWTMSIPARPDSDPDLVLGSALGIVSTRAAQMRVLIEALERVEWEAMQQDDVAGSDPEWVMERIASIAHNALSAAARIGDADAT